MTEDAAVFGGQKNMFDGLENAKAIYKPDMIAVSTTCMAEVIGDDLERLHQQLKKAGHSQGLPGPLRPHLPFVGSHVTGWDNMEEGILRTSRSTAWKARSSAATAPSTSCRLRNPPVGNYRDRKRMLDRDGRQLHHALRSRLRSLRYPRPTASCMYAGGTTMDEVRDAPNGDHDHPLQPMHLERPEVRREHPDHDIPKLNIPMGVKWTDEFLMKVSKSPAPIPASLELERGCAAWT